ncbi:MAG: hypothetical protein ACSLEM_04085 [Candidatus Malihini olakiniferum]
MGTDRSFDNKDSDKSVLSSIIGQEIVLLFALMGIKAENLLATVGVFTGIIADSQTGAAK